MEENLRFRRFVLDRTDGDPTLRAAVVEACRRDPVFFVNVFVWQYNPNKREWPGELGPFVTWDFQDEAIREMLASIREGRDLVIEKSREMGASWLCLIVFIWLWLFYPWQKFLIISRNADAVDLAGEPDSLFWKIDFILERLPKWMLGGFEPKKDRKSMTFQHPNGSTMTGQASTGKAGVGGRATAMFVDEFSQIKEDREVLQRTSDTTKCRIFNGTHLGPGTAFYDLTCRPDIKKLRMHWTQHPDKCRGLYEVDPETRKVTHLDFYRGPVTVSGREYDFPEKYPFVKDGTPSGGPKPFIRSPWYDDQVGRKGSRRGVAMDLDIDAQGSEEQFFDAVQIHKLKIDFCCDPIWEGDFLQIGGVPEGWSERKGGPFRLWFKPGHAPPRSKFSAGVDMAAGTGATPTCLSLMNGNGEKILEYASPTILPDDAAYLFVGVCRWFTSEEGEPAKMAWETNGPGTRFGQKVIEIGFRSVYFHTPEGDLKKTPTTKPGWFPAQENKRLLLEDYRSALYGRKMLNRSREALDECAAFSYNARGQVEHGRYELKDDPSGSRENHGDRVIADALMWMMGKYRSFRPVEVVTEPAVGSLGWRKRLDEFRRRDHDVWV